MKLPDPKKDEAATEVKCFNSACPYSFQDSLEVMKDSYCCFNIGSNADLCRYSWTLRINAV